jgi:hypothetical protein
MTPSTYADLERMQLVRIIGHRIGPEHEVIVVVKNTMENINNQYQVSITDFLSPRFEEVKT